MNTPATRNSATDPIGVGVLPFEKPQDLGIEWDAENRLLAINQGTLRSEFFYDGRSRRVRIVEKSNSIALSDTSLLWCRNLPCEERSGVTVKRQFSGGLSESSGNYFYTFDHLGSVREVTDAVGAVRARYEYDAYGTRTKTLGNYDVQRGFTLNFTPTLGQLALSPGRAYDSNTVRWISEDPSGLRGGINRYTYARNAPTNYWDPTGRIAIAAPAIPFIAEGLAALRALLSAALIGWELGEVAPLPPIAVDDPPDSGPPDNVIPFPPEPVEIIITVERPKPTCPPKPPNREARCWAAFALCAAASDLEGVGVGQCWDSLAQCLDYPNLTVIFPRPKGNVVYP